MLWARPWRGCRQSTHTPLHGPWHPRLRLAPGQRPGGEECLVGSCMFSWPGLEATWHMGWQGRRRHCRPEVGGGQLHWKDRLPLRPRVSSRLGLHPFEPAAAEGRRSFVFPLMLAVACSTPHSHLLSGTQLAVANALLNEIRFCSSVCRSWRPVRTGLRWNGLVLMSPCFSLKA